jgi:L-gulonate 3-dehydrogenase
MKLAIIGCGVVGSSWALVFARAGHEVAIYDRSSEAAKAALAFVASEDSASATRCRIAMDLADALADADYVQESAPERLPIKQALYKEMDALLGSRTIIGSSTSGLPASSFTTGLNSAERCLVAHPINPPHLIPLVELVPSPNTAPSTVSLVHDLMCKLGQSPIKLTREINGFVVNRLQSALLGEAFRLVEDGICTASEVDAAVADGLGLRWAFMGPFATIDLNAANGIAQYCENLGPMYHDLAKEQADPRPWGPALVTNIESDLRVTVPEPSLPQRRRWRDQFLARLIAAKRAISKELNHHA